MGFLCFLTDIQLLQGQEWDGFSFHIKSGDKTLTDFLHQAKKNEVIKTLLIDHIPSAQLSAELNCLLSIIGPEPSEPVQLFSKDTMLGFHSLVIGAFNGFARAFILLKDEYTKLVSMDYYALEM